MKNGKIIRAAILFSAAICFSLAEWIGGRSFNLYSASETASDSPNIILILADDLDVGSIAFMPNLQALLTEQGMTFTNYFANVPLCCPSRASILRGQYAHNHQVLTNRAPDGGYEKFRDLGHETSTIAAWLQDAGYRTVLLGKYLNGYPDNDETYVPPGWDEWYGIVSGLYFNYQLNENGQVVSYDSRPQNYETDVLTRKATDFIRRMAQIAPFFIYLVPNAPHAPVTPAPRHQNEFTGVNAPRPLSFNESDVSDKPAWVQNLPPLTADDVAQIDEDYRNRLRSLLAVDDMIKIIVDTLEALHELDQTYIFFSSDNGFHQGDHRIPFGKNTAYEESIHLPLIVRGPGAPAGEARDHLASVVDLAPTFAELGGATFPGFVDGRSLTPLLNSPSPFNSWRNSVLIEHWVNRDEGIPEFQALRSNSYLYVEYDTNEREFYDLRNDPFELENLYPTADSALLAQFSSRLDSLRQCTGADCFPSDDVPVQANVRGWYADGQVWIIWDLDNDPPETYGIYSSPTPFTNINQAQLIGRLYQEEWLPYALRTQLGPLTATFVIPDGQGGRVALPQNVGLFVETVHESGSKYYAVVKWGQTGVTTNITPQAVSYTFSLDDPVECHLQTSFILSSGHKVTTYYMWADGRANHWEGRQDFPIMANHSKNGMPSFFAVSEAKNLPAGKVSAVHWLSGKGVTTRNNIPDGLPSINIEPQDGLLIAHNDDFIRKVDSAGTIIKLTEESSSWGFGWGKNHDPFDHTVPTEKDTIINYTQRRIIWINDWLVKNRNVDPERVAIQGHGAGSAGVTALAKAFSNIFTTASIFNNGFGGPEPADQGYTLFGTPAQNLPTNLINRKNEVVRIYQVFDLSTPVTKQHDMPIIRSWHGKNDDEDTMKWDAFVVEEYRRADANSWGMQLYWDERPHDLEDLRSHWSNGLGNAQTERDDAAYQVRYRASQSYPAFYNHQNYPGNADPGNGTRGTGGVGVGDDWGTWGGYHDWELDSIVDTPEKWEVTAFLIGLSSHMVDNSPHASLTSDLAIRKPQKFLSPTGTMLDWYVIRISSGDTLQNGAIVVGEDNLVTVQGITVYKDPDRVRIGIVPGKPVAVEDDIFRPELKFMLYQNYPNPFNPSTRIDYEISRDVHVSLKVYDLLGREVAMLVKEPKPAGSYSLVWEPKNLAAGEYFYRLQADDFTQIRKLILIK